MKTHSSWLAPLASLLLWAPATVAEEQSLSLLLLPPIAGEGSAQLAISWQGNQEGLLELKAVDADDRTRVIKSRLLAPGMHLEPVTTSSADVLLVAVLHDHKRNELARTQLDLAPGEPTLYGDIDNEHFPEPLTESDSSTQTTDTNIDWKAKFAGNNGPDRSVNAMVIYDDGTGPALVIGGSFAAVGGIVVSGLARWNGTSWSGFGSDGGLGVAGTVNAMVVVGKDIYVGGAFQQVNVGGPTVDANFVARWNGTEWSNLGGNGGNGVANLEDPRLQTVSALAFMGGDLYVGGLFDHSNIGGAPVAANGVARWSPGTSTWSSLGSTVVGGGVAGGSSWVRAMVAMDGSLYVGGTFFSADGVRAWNVARWNGSEWSALGRQGGHGVDSGVEALAVMNGDIFVGGFFRQANYCDVCFPSPSLAANGIARWRPATATWEALGTETGNGVANSDSPGTVQSLRAVGDTLYVGGAFRAVYFGNITVRAANIARWHPATSTWSSLSSVPPEGLTKGLSLNVFTHNPTEVRALIELDGQLIVGGIFSSAYSGLDSIQVQNLAQWSMTSSSWSAMTGVNDLHMVDSTVRAIAKLGEDICVGGDFTRIRSAGTLIPANRIACWNGSNWRALGTGGGNGLSGTVHALAEHGGELYVGGQFVDANVGGTVVRVNHIARWSPVTATWSGVGSNGGRGFGSSDGTNNATVFALVASGNDLYVGGTFSRANLDGPATNASGIARWNGSNWSALGSGGGRGVAGSVRAIAIAGGDVYVGGFFQNANFGGPEIVANNIARWNGSTWSGVGSGRGSGVGHSGGGHMAGVRALAVLGTDLFAGGDFTRANEGDSAVAVNQIARWDGSNWSSVGSGGGNGLSLASFASSIRAMTVHANGLYVGGDFTIANTAGSEINTNFLARWDGNSWSSVGSGRNGVNGTVRALLGTEQELIAGGGFGRAGSVPSGNVAIYGPTESSVSTITSTSPSVSNPGEDVLVRVRVSSSTAPASGHVTVSGAPGGSCTDLTLTPINATTVEADCSIRWNSDGAQTLIARYTGGSSGDTSWAPSASVPFEHTVAALFDDGFEAQSP